VSNIEISLSQQRGMFKIVIEPVLLCEHAVIKAIENGSKNILSTTQTNINILSWDIQTQQIETS